MTKAGGSNISGLLTILRKPCQHLMVGLSVVGARCLQMPHSGKESVRRLRVLVLGDGCAGAENQSLGLVHHMTRLSKTRGCELHYSVRRILPSRAFRLLPAAAHIAVSRLYPGIGLRDENGVSLSEILGSDSLQSGGGFPDVVIGCGRTTAPACAQVRRSSEGEAFCVQIQDPRCPQTGLFDAIVTPAHDHRLGGGESGQRLLRWGDGGRILTVGSLHRVTEDVLEAAQGREEIRDEIREAQLVVAVLVGGPTGLCPWSRDGLLRELDALISALSTRRKNSGGIGAVVLLSRRTPTDVAQKLAEWAENQPRGGGIVVQVVGVGSWGLGPNPYHAVLSMADLVAPTADSVSMLSEAVGAGKPVAVLCSERCKGKAARMVKVMMEEYGVRCASSIGKEWVQGENRPQKVPRDTEIVAGLIMQRVWEKKWGLEW